MPDFNEYTLFAQEIAKEAGAIMRENFTLHMKKEWKDDHTPLTKSDTSINALVIKEVQKRFPGHAVLGEEQSTKNTNAQHCWVVDPVDGTIPFSHGVPTSAFSLAYVMDGVPHSGVVYDPFLDRLVTAEKGKGAWLNDLRAHVNEAKTLRQEVVTIDGPLHNTGVQNVSFLPLFENTFRTGAKITKYSSMVYGGMLVALGEFTGSICNARYPWDIAALKIIIEEAGGKVTNLLGKEQRYDQEIFGAVLSNGKVHKQLLLLAATTIWPQQI
jgi:myo-inositol-1(or 4)-monophosphatase